MKRWLILLVAALLMIGSMTSCTLTRSPINVQPTTAGNQDLIRTLQSMNFGKYLESPQFEPDHKVVQGWDVYTYPTDELRCILVGEYYIMARKGTEADKTVIWFDGGGACYPGREDCTKSVRFPSGIGEHDLASLDERNPVRDWNFISVPYCDGSIHLGDSDADYNGDGVVDHWHWGLKSTSAAVQLMKELFPASQKILIAGCSAGGGGTIGIAPVVRLQFPDAKLYVLNVSGTGLMNPAMPEVLEVIKKTWNIGQFFPSDCPRCNEQIAYMYSWLLERDSGLKVGLFSSYHDRMISTAWGMDPGVFESLIVSTTETIRAEHQDTFKRFFIAGDMHCLADYSYSVNGISFWDWIGFLVNDDPRWVDIL
jgi:hypothetical protein